jgi:hypothetical protein
MSTLEVLRNGEGRGAGGHGAAGLELRSQRTVWLTWRLRVVLATVKGPTNVHPDGSMTLKTTIVSGRVGRDAFERSPSTQQRAAFDPEPW